MIVLGNAPCICLFPNTACTTIRTSILSIWCPYIFTTFCPSFRSQTLTLLTHLCVCVWCVHLHGSLPDLFPTLCSLLLLSLLTWLSLLARSSSSVCPSRKPRADLRGTQGFHSTLQRKEEEGSGADSSQTSPTRFAGAEAPGCRMLAVPLSGGIGSNSHLTGLGQPLCHAACLHVLCPFSLHHNFLIIQELSR